MADWMSIGGDVVVGGVAGALDQVIQKKDDERAATEAAAGKTLTAMKRYGTYYNYGVPILAIVLAATGILKGSWASRLITAGSVLAGRKIVWQVQTPKPTGYPLWQARGGPTAAQIAAQQAARQAAAARATAAAAPRTPVGAYVLPGEAYQLI